MEPLKILYVEDSLMDVELITVSLHSDGLPVIPHVVDDLEALDKALCSKSWDLVLSDCHFPFMGVEQVLLRVREFDVNLPFIAVSGAIGEEEAVQLLKQGAQDFVRKSNLSRLAPAIRRELQEADGRRARAAAEQALSDSEQRFKLAMRGANDGLWDWNLDTNEVYYSRQWKQMLGYTQEQIEGCSAAFERLVHPDDRPRVMTLLQDCAGGRAERFEAEYRMRHRNGQYVDLLSRAFVVQEKHQCRRLVGTHVDISERKQAELALRSSEAHLRELSAHLQRVREEEKAHIAQEVHDELGSTLTSLYMDIRWLKERLGEAAQPLQDKVEDMSQLVDSAVESCSRIVTELRPSVLDDLGLLAAIEWQANEFYQRHAIRCQVSSNITQLTTSDEQAIAVFRVFQEALTNIARHANADTVEVILLKQGNMLQLQVADNGVGLPGKSSAGSESSWHRGMNERRSERRKSTTFSSGSYGIRGMGERATSLGGRLHLESHPGKGTRVVLRIPLTTDEEPSEDKEKLCPAF